MKIGNTKFFDAELAHGDSDVAKSSVSKMEFESTGKVYDTLNFAVEIRLLLQREHVKAIREAQSFMEVGKDIDSLEEINCQNVVRYMIRTWRPV